MSFAGQFSSSRRREPALRRALGIALGCAAALCIAFTALPGQRAAAATHTAALQVGASIGIRCTIITMPVAFGNYVVANPVHRDAAGAISLDCTPSNFTIRIRIDQGLQPGPGSNNPNPVRQMSDGLGNVLGYNLYRNAARTQVWGGTNPTGVNPPNGPWPMLFPVYGRIPALQLVQPGTYTDVVDVTVLF
jgi:spore coat protein U-like protein